MKSVLKSLFSYNTLSSKEAYEMLSGIAANHFTEHEVSAFVSVYQMRSITIEELLGFREALLEMCLRINLENDEVIDIVGTGGDGKNTFNISTLSCFVVAGAGHHVAKHGNYGVTSISGASNVMQKLGYIFTNEEALLKKQFHEAGICFLHAPLFHPALKGVATLRKNLGLRTFFNLLGPLVNPTSPTYSLIGVCNLEIARIYNYLLQETGMKYTLVHSFDGYDEVSLTSDTKVISPQGENVYSAVALGKIPVQPKQLYGGNTPDEAAKIFTDILSGKGTLAQNAVVIANAAVALHGTGKYPHYADAYAAAVESLDSGRAKNVLKKLLEIQS